MHDHQYRKYFSQKVYNRTKIILFYVLQSDCPKFATIVRTNKAELGAIVLSNRIGSAGIMIFWNFTDRVVRKTFIP